MKLLIIGSTAALLAQLLPVQSAPQVKWVNSLDTSSAEGSANFIGECSNWLITEVCPESKPIQGVLRVGSSINGMKIGAIRCEYQSKTLNGWRGGPRYVAIKGTYNCKAATNRWQTQQSDVRPWAIVIGARL